MTIAYRMLCLQQLTQSWDCKKSSQAIHAKRAVAESNDRTHLKFFKYVCAKTVTDPSNNNLLVLRPKRWNYPDKRQCIWPGRHFGCA